MLRSASREYAQQQRLTALAVNESLRLSARGTVVVAQAIQTYQAAAVALSLGALGAVLDEQGIDASQSASVIPGALLTDPRAVSGMLDKVDSTATAARLVQTFVRDAGRTARATDMATRPAATGYVRSLQAPSCARCAILAGRVYRYSQGFQRHPRCDCLMTPTNNTVGRDLVTDPMDMFEKGQIRDLSKSDAEAVRAGADLSQVVNVRRASAGLTEGSSVMVRAGRLTPQGCLSFASDRAESLTLLRRYGYIT